MKIKSRIIALAAVGIGIPALLVAHPVDRSLQGVWNVTVSGQHMPRSISAVSICGKDGSVRHIGNLEVLHIPGFEAGVQPANGRGHWSRKNANEFQLTFDALLLSRDGAVKGHQHVEGVVTLSSSGETLAGSANTEFLDQNQKVLFKMPVEVKADRQHNLTATR